MPTRRNFLINCSAIAVTASLAPASAFSASLQSTQTSLEQIGFQDFANKVNTLFHVHVDSTSLVALHLIEAKPLLPANLSVVNAEDGRNEKFSLRFAGPARQPLDQNSYVFQHQGIGQFLMFIAPVGPSEPGWCYYEAIFNRPAPRDNGFQLYGNRWLRPEASSKTQSE
jgi:hypothetical protein